MPIRSLALVVLPVLAAGCSCNETEFAGFPTLETETHDPPTSIGSPPPGMVLAEPGGTALPVRAIEQRDPSRFRAIEGRAKPFGV